MTAVAILTQSSVFLDWMKYNNANTDGRDLVFCDIPLYYTHHKTRGWQKRKKGKSIGRLPMAVPRQGEHFYLRILLTIKRGARSHRDLYSVNGIFYEYPSATCRAMGLTFDDSEWRYLFDEVKDVSKASSLRRTLAASLHHAIVHDPQRLWDRFKLAFTDDCLWRISRLGESLCLPPSDWSEERRRFDYGLWLLGDNLRDLGMDWGTARLIGPVHLWQTQERNSLLEDAFNFDHEAESRSHESSVGNFSPEQRAAYNTITNSIDNGEESNTSFLQGHAGTGKTFMYRTLCNRYRSLGKVVLCVASCGIAASLLPSGRTAHSQFRIPLECTDSSTCNVGGQSDLASLLTQTTLIIWDEVTMQMKHHFSAVDRLLRDITGKKTQLFGGVPVLLGGDFAQILPVVEGGGREEITNARIRYWSKWSNITPLFLTENMRVVNGEENQRSADWLSSLSYTPELYGDIEIPGWIKATDDRKVFREFVYPEQLLQTSDTSIFRDRAILASTNDSVDGFNSEIAGLRDVQSQEYYACDEVKDDNSGQISDYTPEYLRTLVPKGLPYGILKLQVGMPVMLLRNYYPKHGLCNGTRLIITSLFNFCVKGRIVSQDPRYNGKEHIISRIMLSSSKHLPFTITRKQLPLRPCFSMTINKSQGQTLQRVGVDLTNPVFSHGQFYVTTSRVTDVNNLIVLLPSRTKKTRNVLYQEVLLRPPGSA